MRFKKKNIVGVEGYKQIEVYDFTVEVPSNWEQGHVWSSHVIAGPAQTYISLNQHNKRVRGENQSLNEFVDFLVVNKSKKDSMFEDFKVVSREELELNGCPAVELEYTRTKVKYVKERDGKERTRYLVVEKDDHFYKLEYSCSESEFSNYLEAYERLKTSFRFI